VNYVFLLSLYKVFLVLIEFLIPFVSNGLLRNYISVLLSSFKGACLLSTDSKFSIKILNKLSTGVVYRFFLISSFISSDKSVKKLLTERIQSYDA